MGDAVDAFISAFFGGIACALLAVLAYAIIGGRDASLTYVVALGAISASAIVRIIVSHNDD
jgi:hypothetical protein